MVIDQSPVARLDRKFISSNRSRSFACRSQRAEKSTAPEHRREADLALAPSDSKVIRPDRADETDASSLATSLSVSLVSLANVKTPFCTSAAPPSPSQYSTLSPRQAVGKLGKGAASSPGRLVSSPLLKLQQPSTRLRRFDSTAGMRQRLLELLFTLCRDTAPRVLLLSASSIGVEGGLRLHHLPHGAA